MRLTATWMVILTSVKITSRDLIICRGNCSGLGKRSIIWTRKSSSPNRTILENTGHSSIRYIHSRTVISLHHCAVSPP
ncbi:uncharacterized protein K460DRAFT_208329 [Cucurbitaria berberidis CBS 394.84]|uniref:Secreted protein n=1 Tax=Cucurbitaria berberidis CBS 394.84 TaxID=1168544 RepID=A0A9P4G804_9PLEO|nr:uncharacterized protein K460DRAFT_208329 [Cucurbitaria berberidis CBS 394.84]KAF1840429.1 hypothetical protein K460DRAFT_208329 [Cucurbitaria berberidis CBS 394.84]